MNYAMIELQVTLISQISTSLEKATLKLGEEVENVVAGAQGGKKHRLFGTTYLRESGAQETFQTEMRAVLEGLKQNLAVRGDRLYSRMGEMEMEEENRPRQLLINPTEEGKLLECLTRMRDLVVDTPL